jgi:hypothetical protein
MWPEGTARTISGTDKRRDLDRWAGPIGYIETTEMDQYVGNQIVMAIGRQRQLAEVARDRGIEQAGMDVQVEREMATGARSLFGRALARAGRSLGLGTASRPEPSAR